MYTVRSRFSLTFIWGWGGICVHIYIYTHTPMPAEAANLNFTTCPSLVSLSVLSSDRQFRV